MSADRGLDARSPFTPISPDEVVDESIALISIRYPLTALTLAALEANAIHAQAEPAVRPFWGARAEGWAGLAEAWDNAFVRLP